MPPPEIKQATKLATFRKFRTSFPPTVEELEKRFAPDPDPLRSNPTHPIKAVASKSVAVTAPPTTAKPSQPAPVPAVTTKTTTLPLSPLIIPSTATSSDPQSPPLSQLPSADTPPLPTTPTITTSLTSLSNQLILTQTRDTLSHLLRRRYRSLNLHYKIATIGVRNRRTQCALSLISNGHVRWGINVPAPAVKRPRRVTMSEAVELLRRHHRYVDYLPTLSTFASKSLPDITFCEEPGVIGEGSKKVRIKKTADQIVYVDSRATVAASERAEKRRIMLVEASRHRNGGWDLGLIESLMVGQEQEREFESEGGQEGLTPITICSKPTPIDNKLIVSTQSLLTSIKPTSAQNQDKDLNDQIITTVLEVPINKLEVKQLSPKPTLTTMRAASMHGDIVDLDLSDVCTTTSSLKSPSTSPRSTISSISSISTTFHATRLSQISSVSLLSEHGAMNMDVNDHLALIVFDEIPETKLEDRDDWPLPKPKALANPLSKQVDLDDTDEHNDTKSLAESEISFEPTGLRRNKTGFIMQKQNNSKVSLHSHGELTEAEISKSGMLLLGSAGVSMIPLRKAKPRSQRPKSLKDMLDKTSGVTRRFQLRRDAVSKKSLAVLTPVSEAFERLTGRKGSVSSVESDGDGEVDEERGLRKRDVPSRLRWEFKGRFIGQPSPKLSGS